MPTELGDQTGAKRSSYVAGDRLRLDLGALLGLRYREGCGPAVVGAGAVIRAGAIIYGDVRIGDDFQCGHNSLIRERSTIGDYVSIGTNSVIDGNVTMGDFIKIQSNCYIPTHTTLGNRVFIGPGVVMTNDKYPLRQRDRYRPVGPILEDSVSVGGGATILPGVRIGAGSFVAAGAVVTRDVPPNSLAVGVPAQISPLPERLQKPNVALSWMHVLTGE